MSLIATLNKEYPLFISLALSGVTGGSKITFAPGRSDFDQGRPNSSGVVYAMENYIGNIHYPLIKRFRF